MAKAMNCGVSTSIVWKYTNILLIILLHTTTSSSAQSRDQGNVETYNMVTSLFFNSVHCFFSSPFNQIQYLSFNYNTLIFHSSFFPKSTLFVSL